MGWTSLPKIKRCHFLAAKVKLCMTATPKLHPDNENKPSMNGFWGFKANGVRKTGNNEKKVLDPVEELESTAEENSSDGQTNSNAYDKSAFACQNDPNGVFGPPIHCMSLGDAMLAGLVLDCKTVSLQPKIRDPRVLVSISETVNRISGYQMISMPSHTCSFCKSRSIDREKEIKEQQNRGGLQQERKDLVNKTLAIFSHVLYYIAKGEVHKVVAYAKDTSRAKLVAEVCHLLSYSTYNHVKSGTIEVFDILCYNEEEKNYFQIEQNRKQALCNIEAFYKNCDCVCSNWEYNRVSRKVEKFTNARCGMLSNCQIMKIGQNVKTIDAIVLLDQINSLGDFIQIIGRGVRTLEEADVNRYKELRVNDINSDGYEEVERVGPDRKYCRLFLATCMKVDKAVDELMAESAPLDDFKDCLKQLYSFDCVGDCGSEICQHPQNAQDDL